MHIHFYNFLERDLGYSFLVVFLSFHNSHLLQHNVSMYFLNNLINLYLLLRLLKFK